MKLFGELSHGTPFVYHRRMNGRRRDCADACGVDRAGAWLARSGLAVSVLTVWCTMPASVASAQDRPFLFSITTASDTAKPAMRVDYDLGAGERAFQGRASNQPEQRIGVQASRGRLTFIGRVGMVDSGSSYQSSQGGEVLFSLANSPNGPLAFAAGGGVQHESDGIDVLLARVTAGRERESWRLHGNLVLQKPLSSARDRADLVTTVGWARKLNRTLAIGVEGVGEDLEAFWDPAEAEGGARILVGPSLHVTPAGRKWQLTGTGGPTLHSSGTGRRSDALRDLPPASGRVGYVVRASLTYKVF